MVKNLPANAGDGFLEKEMATQSIFLLGKSHGQRSLAGYSSWGHKVSDMTERLKHIFYIEHIFIW